MMKYVKLLTIFSVFLASLVNLHEEYESIDIQHSTESVSLCADTEMLTTLSGVCDQKSCNDASNHCVHTCYGLHNFAAWQSGITLRSIPILLANTSYGVWLYPAPFLDPALKPPIYQPFS